jgi:hypothetical protein
MSTLFGTLDPDVLRLIANRVGPSNTKSLRVVDREVRRQINPRQRALEGAASKITSLIKAFMRGTVAYVRMRFKDDFEVNGRVQLPLGIDFTLYGNLVAFLRPTGPKRWELMVRTDIHSRRLRADDRRDSVRAQAYVKQATRLAFRSHFKGHKLVFVEHKNSSRIF